MARLIEKKEPCLIHIKEKIKIPYLNILYYFTNTILEPKYWIKSGVRFRPQFLPWENGVKTSSPNSMS